MQKMSVCLLAYSWRVLEYFAILSTFTHLDGDCIRTESTLSHY
jgi:hypothetical protein